MELIHWKNPGRKRNRNLSYTDPEYIRGYDLDGADFALLVDKFNAGALTRPEENRLLDHVLTVMRIVSENPEINPKGDELSELVDFAFPDAWGSLRYIKDGKSPYSYVYRTTFNAYKRFYTRRQLARQKTEAIAGHIEECMREYTECIRGCRVFQEMELRQRNR